MVNRQCAALHLVGQTLGEAEVGCKSVGGEAEAQAIGFDYGIVGGREPLISAIGPKGSSCHARGPSRSKMT